MSHLKLASIVLVGIFTLALAVGLADFSLDRWTGSMTGTVTNFETFGKSRVRHRISVRLKDGNIVQASNDLGIATPIGSRVELAEHTGPIIGLHRYELMRTLDADGK